jgi:hypothetical protein
MCKEEIVAYLKVLFRHLPVNLSKATRNLIQGTRELNRTLLEYKSEIHCLSQFSQWDYYYYYYYYCWYNQWTDYYMYSHYHYPPHYGAWGVSRGVDTPLLLQVVASTHTHIQGTTHCLFEVLLSSHASHVFLLPYNYCCHHDPCSVLPIEPRIPPSLRSKLRDFLDLALAFLSVFL